MGERGHLKYLSTGYESLDQLLGGGIQCGHLTLIDGEPRVGTTSVTIHCAFSAAKNYLKTFFVDADKTFSLHSIHQIAGNQINSVSRRIFVFQPQNFQEQSLLIENLESYNLRSVDLIIVDSITTLYITELSSTDKWVSLNMKLNRQLAYLKEIAKYHNLPILLTNKLYSHEVGDTKIEPIANRVINFWVQKIIRLESTQHPSVKKAKLIKGVTEIKNGTIYFNLFNNG